MAQFDPCSVDAHTFDKDIKAIEKRQASSTQSNEKKSDDLMKLYIEPTSKCNLACTMCFRNTWIDEAFADMEISVFDKVINTMPESVETVFFGGMGEPLYHKDIVYMVQSASSKGKRVELLTNGTLLTQDMVTKLLDAGLHMLWVSIDSFDPEGYEIIRQNSKFSVIKNNLLMFNTERLKRNSDTELGIAFVAMKSNVRQLGLLTRFVNANNVSRVNISNVIPTDKASLKESLFSRLVSLEINTQNAYNPQIDVPFMDFSIPEAKEGFSELLNSNCNVALSGKQIFRKNRYCRFIEENTSFVRYDGDVSPCMALLHSGVTYLDEDVRTVYHHSFGNVASQSLTDIWNNQEYSEFRQRVRKFDFSPCIHCGGCENRVDNCQDCLGNQKPTCGACLWSEGIISCP